MFYLLFVCILGDDLEVGPLVVPSDEKIVMTEAFSVTTFSVDVVVFKLVFVTSEGNECERVASWLSLTSDLVFNVSLDDRCSPGGEELTVTLWFSECFGVVSPMDKPLSALVDDDKDTFSAV